MLAKELNSRRIEEKVISIDCDARQNKIDGVNKEFYVQMSYYWFIGDTNGDGEVNADDVIVWEYDSTNDTKTKRTIASIDPELGKVTLESPPSQNVELTMTYSYCPVNINTPDPMIKLACCYLASALAFTRMSAKCFDKMALGKLSLAKTQKTFQIYYDNYRQQLNLIKTRMLRRTHDKNLLVYP